MSGQKEIREKVLPVDQVKNGNGSRWRLRREVTIPAAAQLGAILLALVIGWSNLQSELVLIRHDLNQLLRTNEKIEQQLNNLQRTCGEHEYRLKMLEEKREG